MTSIKIKAILKPDEVKHILDIPSTAKIPAWFSVSELPSNLLMNPALFKELWDLHPEELGKVKMLGKVIDTPRYQANYGKEYFYTGILHQANVIPHDYLKELLAWVCENSGEQYEQMIINWYRDGSDYIGPHSDSETGLVPNSTIYSITFGGTRDFVIRAKTGNYRKVLSLKENTVLKMGGSMQRYFKHEVPKRAYALPRINVTFRLMSH